MKKILCLVACLVALPAIAQQTPLGAALDPLKDYRYCGTPKRDTSGRIARSSKVLRAHQKQQPCPSTGLTTGACPGWAQNHEWPLACGGCDAVFNLAWMPNDTKSSSNPHAVDRYERKIWHAPEGFPVLCQPEIVK